jgi:hypothetical protein
MSIDLLPSNGKLSQFFSLTRHFCRGAAVSTLMKA